MKYFLDYCVVAGTHYSAEGAKGRRVRQHSDCLLSIIISMGTYQASPLFNLIKTILAHPGPIPTFLNIRMYTRQP